MRHHTFPLVFANPYTPLRSLALLTGVLSLAAHCGDGPIGTFRRVIVNESGVAAAVTIAPDSPSGSTYVLPPGDSAVNEGTCYWRHVGRHSCDFVTDLPSEIVFADSLRLEQAFARPDQQRWVGANLPAVDSSEGYVPEVRGGIETFRYVIGGRDLRAAEPF